MTVSKKFRKGMSRMRENIKQLQDKKGPNYRKWKRNLRKSL